jgi:hypothetical protein
MIDICLRIWPYTVHEEFCYHTVVHKSLFEVGRAEGRDIDEGDVDRGNPVAACTYLLLCFVCRCPQVITAVPGRKVNKPKGRCSLLAAAVLLYPY